MLHLHDLCFNFVRNLEFALILAWENAIYKTLPLHTFIFNFDSFPHWWSSSYWKLLISSFVGYPEKIHKSTFSVFSTLSFPAM